MTQYYCSAKSSFATLSLPRFARHPSLRSVFLASLVILRYAQCGALPRNPTLASLEAIEWGLKAQFTGLRKLSPSEAGLRPEAFATLIPHFPHL